MIHSLNLNKHPKDCDNLSLINAENVKISDDNSCLQSENQIIINDVIKRVLDDFYEQDYIIISLIPCNTELLIFTARSGVNSLPIPVNIFRYNERLNECKLAYSSFNYYNGEITGDFTYNVNDELIVAIAEHNGLQDVPLRTINFGKFEENNEKLSNKLLPINPEVIIPTISDYNYVSGVSKRGWYYIFIRYKIDKQDYTQWFDIGGPILIETLEKQAIFKLYGYKKDETDFRPFTTGAVDHFASTDDVAHESINIDLKYLDKNYNKYQIGFICVNKDSTIAYHSLDLDINISSYTLNYDIMESYDYGDMIINNSNFYNVKNVINYNNRLYVSNYKEKDLNDYDTSNIVLSLDTDIKEYYDVKGVEYKSLDNENALYKTIESESNEALEVDTNDSAEAELKLPLIKGGNAYNDLITSTEKSIRLDSKPTEFGGNESPYFIYYYNKDGSLKKDVKRKTEYNSKGKETVITYTINKVFKIETANGKLLDVQFHSEETLDTRDGITRKSDTEFRYVINGKTYTSPCYVEMCGNFRYNDAAIQITVILGEITNDILIQPGIINNNRYINTKNSFNERKKDSTLIPGEIYNFYIHFVDKYGFTTRGFKLNPKNKYRNTLSQNYGSKEVIPVSFEGSVDGIYFKYLFVNPNTRVFNENGKIELNVKDCQGLANTLAYVTYADEIIHGPGQCFINTKQIEDHLNELYGKLNYIKNLVWEDIVASDMKVYIVNNVEELDNFLFAEYDNLVLKKLSEFIPYKNNNGDYLFKIPFNKTKYISGNNTTGYEYTNFKLKIDNVKIPDDYIGYFISGEAVEETAMCTGLVTMFDFNRKDYNNTSNFIYYNGTEKSNKVYFYCSDFDIAESIKLKYNLLRIEKSFPYSRENDNILIDSIIENPVNLNLIENNDGLFTPTEVSYYPIKNYRILVAGDAVKGRYGLGTCLEITLDEEINPGTAIASLLHVDNNIYISKDKKLIKYTNIVYPGITEEEVPIQFLPGHNTYDGTIIYDQNRFIYNSVTTRVYAEKHKAYITYEDEDKNGEEIEDYSNKLLVYFQFPLYKNFFCESKSFKNNPQQVTYLLEEVDDKTEEVTAIATQLGVMVIPINTIDLFENKLSYPEELYPKPYINNRNDVTYITQFDKFIRRSDIIKDESLSNSWRKFGLENYKVISENKGKITNLIGIGHYLLVHTEHSLFVFDGSNTLKAIDQDIKLTMPDIFDIDYREVVTSDLGFAGLQDKHASIVDQFGYIFYDNDSNRIFRFDQGALNYIDTNIIQFLNKYKPNTIRFAHDKKSTRLLLSITFNDINSINNKVLSYHYGLNTFISFHDYKFDFGTNTKNKLYLRKIGDSNLYSFDYENITNTKYNQFKNGTNEIVNSKLDIIINDDYNIIKMLEYILYKLYKININEGNYEAQPVEGMRIPYSGEFIRVYNNEIDTGLLDIKIDVEPIKGSFRDYRKPYWNLGNWNFNYLRNNISNKLNSDFMSRLYGNYFIISIIFGGTNERFEFESLGYNITKDKKI